MQGPPAGQNPHSLFPGEEKENAPFDGVREKGSGGGIPDFVRNARSAWDRGLAWQSSEVLPSVSALDRNGTPGPARMLCRPLFAAAPWHSRKRSRPHCQSSATTGLRQQKRSREHPGAPLPPSSRNCRCAAAKEEQGAYLNSPSFRTCHTWLSGRKLSNQQPITPVQGGKRHFRRSLKCRRRAFFS